MIFLLEKIQRKCKIIFFHCHTFQDMRSTETARPPCIDFDEGGIRIEFRDPLTSGDVFVMRRSVESLAFDENEDMYNVYVYGEGACGVGRCIGSELPWLCRIDSLAGALSLELRVEERVPQLRLDGGQWIPFAGKLKDPVSGGWQLSSSVGVASVTPLRRKPLKSAAFTTKRVVRHDADDKRTWDAEQGRKKARRRLDMYLSDQTMT